MALIRHVSYTKIGDGSQVRFKKWSAVKLITLMRDITELLKMLPADINLAQLTPAETGRLITVIPTLGEKLFGNLVKLIRESIDDPPGQKDEDILAWDIEDVVNALKIVIEQNWTEDLRKNLSSLGATIGLAGRSASIPRLVPEA